MSWWAQVRAAQRDLRDLCGLMSGQMARFRTLLESARNSAENLGGNLQLAEGQLTELKRAADSKGQEARAAERAGARAQADKATLAAQLAAQRRAAAGVAEAADTLAIERGLVARGAEEAREACTRLEAGRAAAVAAKQAAQAGLLERDEELCGLYERSATLQKEMDEGEVGSRLGGTQASSQAALACGLCNQVPGGMWWCTPTRQDTRLVC